MEGLALEALYGRLGIDVDAAQARLAELMKAEGLPYGKRTHTYNSRLAQELAKWAEEQPGGERIHDALFRAYFVEGINLARVDRLVEIVGTLGLPESEARDALESRSYRAKVDADWSRSAELGVTGVPTFVVNGEGIVGAQPYPILEQFVADAGARRRE
jgi:predicted DsbA family dithiol-disulfide isomerase